MSTLAGRVKRANKPTLAHCEQQIQSAIDAARETWQMIGVQLRVIRDNELFPDKSFEEYCDRRWEFSRAHAYRLIGGAEVVDNLSPMGGAPATERQAREVGLASDDPGEQQQVWDTAKQIAGNDQPPATVIRKAAEIVRDATDGNPESIEIDAAIREFSKLVKKAIESGKRIQTAFNAKVGACQPMRNRKKKYDNRIDALSIQVDLLREHIEGLETEWAGTKKQVDE